MKKVLLLVVLIFTLTSCWTKTEVNNVEETHEKVEEHKEEMKENHEEMEEKHEEEMKSAWTGKYIAYSDESLKEAKWIKVIFFYTSTNEKSESFKSNIEKSGVHTGLTIFEADFTKADELKKKYNITEEHSFVLVGNEGELKKNLPMWVNLDDLHKAITGK